MADTRTALVVGAGIGGLAAGVALRRAGWRVRHEQAATERSLGFGLLLAPNALSALRELSVADAVTKNAAPAGRIEIRRTNGRVLRRLNAQAWGAAVVALRPDLHGALLAAVGDEALRFGSDAVSFSQNGGGVVLRLDDGTTDTGDVLIGADGVNSGIRRLLHPDEARPRPSGFAAVRGVAHGATAHLEGVSGVVYFDDGIEAATIRAGTDAVYWYLSLRSSDVRTRPEPAAILNDRLRGFEPGLRAILEATTPDDMRFDELFERDPLRSWGAGGVTLLGDAAHPLLPHTGQGAAQALEDAVAIGLALARSDAVESGLRQYESVRAHRTRAFIKLGPRIARVTTTHNTAIRAVRSLAIRLLPEFALTVSAARLGRDPHGPLRGAIDAVRQT